MSKKAIRIIAIVLAALMVLSVLAVLLQVFGAELNTAVVTAPVTGDNDMDYILPIALISVAVIGIVLAIVIFVIVRLHSILCKFIIVVPHIDKIVCEINSLYSFNVVDSP